MIAYTIPPTLGPAVASPILNLAFLSSWYSTSTNPALKTQPALAPVSTPCTSRRLHQLRQKLVRKTAMMRPADPAWKIGRQIPRWLRARMRGKVRKTGESWMEGSQASVNKGRWRRRVML